MTGMAGKDTIISGTFTATETGLYTINFGKTITGRYIAYIEMTDASKSTFATAVQSIGANRTYGCIGINWNGCDKFDAIFARHLARYNGTDVSLSYGTNAPINKFKSDSIVLSVASISGNANVIYPNYTYNYMIIPLV